MVRPTLLFLFALAVPCLVGLPGCAEPTPAAVPPTTFCKDGTVSCIGNVIANCTGGGKAYQLTPCGESKFCSNGACEKVVCEKASLACSPDGKKVMVCPDDGSAERGELKACAATETCKAGACVTTACTDGAVVCGWRKVLTCKGKVWMETACGANQLCDASQKKCVDRKCSPTAIACKSETTAQVCSAAGDAWQDKGCGTGNVCEAGVCHTKLAGSGPTAGADATVAKDTTAAATDTAGNADAPGFLDIPKKDVQLEQADKFTVTFSETQKPAAGTAPMKFDQSSAAYLSGLSMLQISGNFDLFKVEIQIKDVEDFQLGTFVAGGETATETKVQMNDGSPVDWRYQAVDWEVTITEWEDVGGRVKGTFSAELADTIQKGKKAYLIDGVFDVKRSQ